MTKDIVDRLRKRATIRRSIRTEDGHQGEFDRLANLLEEAANVIEYEREEYDRLKDSFGL